MTIAITGATGNIGGQVAQHLAAAGLPLRLLVRDLARAPALPGAEVAVVDYADAASAAKALEGIELLFMVSAAESADRLAQHRAFIGAAAAAGVGHLVYTSFINAAPDATFTLARDHWATEEHIRAAGMTHTFLRDSFYLDFLPELAGPDGVIRGPAGHGVVGAVARADVARVAAAVLSDPGGHRDRTYDLTGREALNLDDVARILSEETGRSIVYDEEEVEEAYASRRPYGVPDWQLEAWVSTYTAIEAGELATLSDHVELLTGRRPLTLRELLNPQA